MNDLLAYLKPGLEHVNSFIDAALRSDIELLDSTNRSLREHPGKMMRPMLALLVARAASSSSPLVPRSAGGCPR